MTNETIKRLIRKEMEKKEIIIGKISFQNVCSVDNVVSIGKCTMTLEENGAVRVDVIKSIIEEIEIGYPVMFCGILLDI